ncbi:MAG: ABC transporter ATP-binding protein [Gammaproteobacteria bacterium]|nr:ABC transporter ATP-binding protein [Gammaproteobacteria bacterium]
MMAVGFQDVSKHYRERPAVTEFTLQVQPEERLVLLGPSGCGKTTVLRLLAGLIAPDHGQIAINDEVVAMDGRNLKGPEARALGMVFQDLALWPHLTVRGNLEFGLKAQGVPAAERQARICKTLGLMQLQGYAEAWPGDLSGGQQQRTALARALVLSPKLLLMDEPLSSLDFELNFQLRQELLRLQGELRFTLIYVTHNLEEAFDIATRIVVMKDGRIERIGDVSEIRAHFQQLLYQSAATANGDDTSRLPCPP